MKLQELTEMASKSPYVYHVTFSDKVPSIKKKGLLPLQTSNWKKNDGKADRYNKEGGVFAFRDPEDAYRWAFKQNWDFDEPVAIVKIKGKDQWHLDPSEDIHLKMGKGEAVRSIDSVKPEDIAGSVEFADFKNPMELDMKPDEFMQRVIGMLEK